jgi:hypothetical protein
MLYASFVLVNFIISREIWSVNNNNDYCYYFYSIKRTPSLFVFDLIEIQIGKLKDSFPAGKDIQTLRGFFDKLRRRHAGMAAPKKCGLMI